MRFKITNFAGEKLICYTIIMNDQPAIELLDMTMLPLTERTLFFEDELMLADNFEPMSQIAEWQSLLAKGAFKIGFAVSALCTAGYVRVRRNFKECRIEASDLFVAFVGDIVECLEISKDCQIGVIVSKQDRMLDIAPSPMTVFFHKYMTKQSVFHFSSEEMSETMGIYHQMRRKIVQRDCQFARMALLGCIQMLGSIGCQWATDYCNDNKEEPKTDNSQQRIFDSFLELLKQHFREERMIEFYATKLSLTSKYLSGIVRQVSGLSAADWIKEYVIIEAQSLLKSKRYTVVQVADMLNFPNASFFGKYFKAATGCTPREFMLQ